MEKPKLFKNKNININNNKESCLLKNIEEEKNDINKELNKIFNSFRNIYHTKVLIETESRTYETYLISRTNNNVKTINNEIIPIKEIINLTIK